MHPVSISPQSRRLRRSFKIPPLVCSILCAVSLMQARAAAQNIEPVEEVTVQLSSSGDAAIVSGAAGQALRIVEKGKIRLKLKDANGNDTTDFKLSVAPDPSPTVKVDDANKLITAEKTGPSKVMIESGGVRQSLSVEAVASSDVRISFEGDADDRIIGPGKAIKVKARVADKDGKALSGAQLQWDVADDSKPFVEIVPRGKEATLVEAASDAGAAQNRPASFTVIARDVNSGRSNALNVRTEDVSFRPLDVSIEVLPDGDVSDLFGSRAAKEFYVAEVSVTNNVRGGDGVGSSILIFSQNLRTAVSYEGKYNGDDLHGAEEANMPKNRWINLTPGMDGHRNQSSCPKHPWLRRAFPYDTMVDTVNSREDRNLRSRALLYANSLSTLTSFVTSVAVPGSGSDLPLGLDKFQNLLIPGFQRLFSDKREAHRQQVLKKVLQPIEEVAFGQQLTKYVFFPKKSFKGVKRGYKTRISEICPDSFQIEIALLKNGTKSIFQPGPTEAINVTGRVTDPSSNNAPLADVKILLKDANGGVVRESQTDGSGNYTLDRVPAGNYRLEFSKANFAASTETLTNLTSSKTISIPLSRAAYSLAGLVKSSTGTLLKGVTVNINAVPGRSTTTNDAGRYNFDNLPAGERYEVTPALANFTFAPKSHTLTANKNDLDFTGTQNAFALSGKVTEEGGAAIPGVGVTIKREDNNQQVGAPETTNAEGRYRFASLSPGVAYVVSFAKSNFNFPASQIPADASGDQERNATGTPANYNLSGVARDASNNPLADVTVNVVATDDGTTLTATTKADGSYRVQNLKAGKSYFVTARKEGFKFTEVPPITNMSGDEFRPLNATPSP